MAPTADIIYIRRPVFMRGHPCEKLFSKDRSAGLNTLGINSFFFVVFQRGLRRTAGYECV